MGIVSQSVDLFYAYKFIRLLTTPWRQTEAFKLGIIDENGKLLIRPSQFKTSEQRSAYTYFNRLIFNIKRLLSRAPGGSSQIASYASALFLIREEFGISDHAIKTAFEKFDITFDEQEINESWYILGNGSLSPGSYALTQDIALPVTGEMLAKRGTKVIVNENTEPFGYIFDEPIFKVKHVQTKQEIYVTAKDLIR